MSVGETQVPSGRNERPKLFERLRSLFGFQGNSAREDIADALKDGSAGSEFSQQERVLIENVLSLHDLRVRDVMVPRVDVIAIELETSLSELLKVFRTAGHSRLPVYSVTLDDPRGMVHIRDFVDFVARSAEEARLPILRSVDTPQPPSELVSSRRAVFDLSVALSKTNILRPVLYAPPSMPALDLLVKMQASHTHMALVIDEYGGTDGLVSIEDIVEKIVGDIEDEHDLNEDPNIEKMPDGSFVIDARASIQDVSLAIGREIATSEDVSEIDTVAGYVTKITGRVPIRGEIVRIDKQLEFEVLDADPRRVKRVKARFNEGPAFE